jgi:transketolase
MDKIQYLSGKAVSIRKRLLRMIFEAKGGHTGGSLSSVDILVALYFDILNVDPKDPGKQDRDRFILSKGHSVESYYCVLAEAGFFPDEWLDTYGTFNSPLAGHPVNKVPGIEINSGSLGHGLSAGVGMALASRMDGRDSRVYVLMGDGEQAEGSVLEAAMAAGNYKLDGLAGIIDRNRLQISGDTEKIMKLDSLSDRYRNLGWETREINGNSFGELLEAFHSLPFRKEHPSLVIANTIKGKGVSFIEDRAEWHHRVPTQEELGQALDELDKQTGNIE